MFCEGLFVPWHHARSFSSHTSGTIQYSVRGTNSIDTLASMWYSVRVTTETNFPTLCAELHQSTTTLSCGVKSSLPRETRRTLVHGTGRNTGLTAVYQFVKSIINLSLEKGETHTEVRNEPQAQPRLRIASATAPPQQISGDFQDGRCCLDRFLFLFLYGLYMRCSSMRGVVLEDAQLSHLDRITDREAINVIIKAYIWCYVFGLSAT